MTSQGHPDRWGLLYRFPHLCPGYAVCAIARWCRKRGRLGLKRRYVARMRV